MICSDSTLKDEISCLTGIFVNNGYPLDVQSVIRDKTAMFNKIKPATVGKCPVYLRLPWLGGISESFAKQISCSSCECYFAANVRVVFQTRSVLSFVCKDDSSV